MLLRVPTDAPGFERALTEVAEPRRARDVLALNLPFHRDLHRFALLRHRPRDGDVIVGDAAFERKLTVFVDDAASELRAVLVDRHRNGQLAGRDDELDAPVAGNVGRGKGGSEEEER